MHVDIDLFGEKIRPAAEAVLKRRFIFPPFSVLSARDGDWQERKRAWLLIGIRSELGRGDVMPSGAGSCYSGASPWAGKRGPATGDFNSQAGPEDEAGLPPRGTVPADRTGLTWSSRGIAEFDHYPVKEGARENTDTSGTSVFDPVLCELAYRWFCPPGGAVLDPFAGGSVRGVVASALGRRYHGCDLSARQIEANEAQQNLCDGPAPLWRCGDAIDVATLFPYLKADFVFSCPPYADLERYSDDPRDLSTMAYPDFVGKYREIIAEAVALLKPDSFACFVVGDVRDKRGFYYGFPADTARAFADAGAPLYNEAILVTAVGSLPVRINAQFRAGRKLGKTHQNVLVFCKGDPKRAAAKCEAMTAAETGSVQDAAEA